MRVLFFLIVSFFASAGQPLDRSPAFPFVSGDGFRSIADHIFEEDLSIDPIAVQSGDILFVKGALLADFFEKIHPQIQADYILISHNSDNIAPGSFAPFLESDHLIAWFGINYDGYSHPKMHPIPIGIANRYTPYGDSSALVKIIAQKNEKKHLVTMNFSIQTYSPERWGVFKRFAQAPYCYRTGKKPFGDYLTDVAASCFNISPRGFGLDTYRLWETLYLGTIPIVKTSSLNSLYEDLPILIIEEWEEVDEPFLNEKYRAMTQKSYSLEKLEMNYWVNLIEHFR